MKPILIDEIKDSLGNCMSECKVEIDGVEHTGYQIAKPLNYDPKYMSKKNRKEMAKAIMDGKAIAVCFFEDLSEEEKQEYIKKKMK